MAYSDTSGSGRPSGEGEAWRDFRSKELRSLRDMIRFEMGDLVVATNMLTAMGQQLQTLGELGVDKVPAVNVDAIKWGIDHAAKIERICEAAEIDASAAARDLREHLEKLKAESIKQKTLTVSSQDVTDLEQMLLVLNSSFHHALEKRFALMLSASEAKLYDPKQEPLFGPDVATKFHLADYDIAEAAKCLALERATAAAFHSMRVAELGVRALASCLGIPDPTKPAEKNWGIVLGHIKKDGLDVKWPKAVDRMTGDGAEMEALYASLDAMKNPWRNATMHVERTYQPYEAKEVYDATRAFMQRLAKRMDQDGAPKA